MSEKICQTCNNQYNKGENRPIILSCGDSLCSNCIKKYKEIYKKDSFECPNCCNETQSTNIENKSLYPKENEVISNNSVRAQQPGEFEIYIRPKGNDANDKKYTIIVYKSMTIGQLKQKINDEKGYDKNLFTLAYTRPLTDESKTIESYGITRTVTLTQISKFRGGNQV